MQIIKILGKKPINLIRKKRRESKSKYKDI